jgi:hypothetical protein
MDCRVRIGGRDAGAAFAIGSRLALTARHVVRTAIDRDGRLAPSSEVELVLEGHPGVPVTDVGSDVELDVAVLEVGQDLPRWIPVGNANDGAPWQVTGRPRGDDPGLSGRITFATRVVRSADDHEVPLMQLLVDQHLGDYEGYSGSAVIVPGTGDGRRPVAVGVLIEQVRWRVQPSPGTRLRPVANVLYAAPLGDALARLGLGGRVAATTDRSGDDRRTMLRPEDDIALTRLLRETLGSSDLRDIAAAYGLQGRLSRRNFAARLPGDGLDAQIRALVEDAGRTNSAHVLLRCIATSRPDLAESLPSSVDTS